VLVLKIDQRIMKGIKVQKRQLLLLAAAGFLGMAGRANGQKPLVLEQRAMPETKAVELTLLRSIDADPTLAAQFIKANWFAMDAIAKARGLMTFFNLHVDPTPREDWNLVVQVGYPDVRGFEAIQSQWSQIVAAHQTVLIEGKRLPDLARIIGTRRLLPA
jgi:hypothetical protein